jgi:hypothetical protein
MSVSNNRVVHLGIQDFIECMFDLLKKKKKHFVSDSLLNEAIEDSRHLQMNHLTNFIKQSDNYLK